MQPGDQKYSYACAETPHRVFAEAAKLISGVPTPDSPRKVPACGAKLGVKRKGNASKSTWVNHDCKKTYALSENPLIICDTLGGAVFEIKIKDMLNARPRIPLGIMSAYPSVA